MDGDMFGQGRNQHWKSQSASNPDDPDNFDTNSMFNRFKFGRKTAFNKKEKTYKKYEADKDSNFHKSKRGYNARPDLFQTKYTSYFWTRIYNPFVIRDYANFDKEPTSKSEKRYAEAKKHFDEQTHESMTRKPMKNKDFKKVLPIKGVAVILTVLFGTNKAVCAYV